MRGPISKVCECCKQGFTCGQYGCWCAKVEVGEQQMAWIDRAQLKMLPFPDADKALIAMLSA